MAKHPPLPYEFLPEVPSFTVESWDISDGQPLDDAYAFNDWGMTGDNLSPHLHWSDFPEETKGFAISCFDPDAPTGSGFWHMFILDVPGSVNELLQGAASPPTMSLPGNAFCVRNDYGVKAYGGAAPPDGHGPHRYVFAVHALDTESLGVDSDVSPAVAGFNTTFHTIARGLIIPTYER
jgi:Raf kinase inhibitor-like YbhB/YbcL family protein